MRTLKKDSSSRPQVRRKLNADRRPGHAVLRISTSSTSSTGGSCLLEVCSIIVPFMLDCGNAKGVEPTVETGESESAMDRVHVRARWKRYDSGIGGGSTLSS